MKTLKEIRDRCRIEDDHWIWTGALSGGIPRLWAPDFTTGNGKPCAQMGRRAVWHVKTGQPIPNGWRVFGSCEEALCLNPAHMECSSDAERGAKVAAAGTLKGRVNRIVANRAINRKRSRVTREVIAQALSSNETGVALAARSGVKRQTISKIRRGRMYSFQPVGGLFSSLLAANDHGSKQAA